MKEAIIEKLENQFSESIYTECKVVYIFSLIRKYYEKYLGGIKNMPSTLRLFSNWVLHIDLTGFDTTRNFLKMIDECVPSILGPTDLIREHNLYQELVHFITLKKELNEFLVSVNIDPISSKELWRKFILELVEVLKDGSLKCNSPDLINISEIQFSTEQASGLLPLQFIYEISLIRVVNHLKKLRIALGVVGGVPEINHTVSVKLVS